MSALTHRHALQRLQGEVFAQNVRGEQFFDNDDLIMYLAEANEEIAVRCRIDTPIEIEYFAHGGILPFVLRQLIAA